MNAPADTRPDQTLEHGFQLAELRIDPHAGEVAGPGGREKLDPKVMDVLVMLAQHAGQVVLREDLLARLWPNAVVTDDALSRCLYELRRQLSQAGGDERFKAMLETVPKRGYRLNGEITPLVPPPVAGSATPLKWRILVPALVILITAVLWFVVSLRTDGPPAVPSVSSPTGIVASIAILPFVDMSTDQSQEHISDGVTEEILNRLTQNRNLRVIARTSSFLFKDESMSIPEIASVLDVTHVLEGSVRRSGKRVRITARLVEASSNSQMWSETYDREMGDLFAVQDEIAASVATALRTTLAGTTRSAPPANPEAHEFFLRGEFFYNRRAPGDIARSAKYYQDALTIEPGYARAWAGLAGAYSLLAYEGEIPAAEGLKRQGEAARKAVELDPQLAVGHARLSQYYWDVGDLRTAWKIWDTAQVLDPDDLLVMTFAAGLAMWEGKITKAIDTQRRIVARDPLSAAYHANLGMYLLATDELEEAKSELLKALELNPNFSWDVDLAIARILILQGQLDEARKLIDQVPEDAGRDHGLALLARAQGRQAEANAAVERLAAKSKASPDIRLAEVHAYLGRTEEAFRALRGLKDAIDRNEPNQASQIWSWQVELRVSPFLRPLYGDPRWPPLLVGPEQFQVPRT